MTGPLFALALVVGAADAGVPDRLTIAFGGDVTLGYHYEELVDDKLDAGVRRDEALAHGFARVAPLVSDDELFVVNLECPFTAGGEKIPKNFNFRARPELVATLQSGGVDVVSLANNHLVDYGAAGLFETQSVLDAAGIKWFGAGRNLAAAREPRVVARNGVRVAFLGYFFLGDRNIEPPQVIATATTPGVAGHFSDQKAMLKMVRDDVKRARAHADVVLPFFHWGREGTSALEPYQLTLAHAAIEAGAAGVIGSHPHVLQGMELYRGAPILYSLGNFVFGGNWNPRNKETALVKLTFSRRGFEGATVTPLHSDRYPEVPIQPYPVQGEQADAVLRHLAEYSQAFPQMLPALAPYAAPADAGVPDAGR